MSTARSARPGQEQERTLFRHRARLFTMSSGQTWVEAGSGDAKLLLHIGTNRTRLVMRKDKTSSILLNQLVQPDAELLPAASEDASSSDRAFIFEAEDFATGQMRKETFAIRFKTEASAREFKMKYMEAQERNRLVFAAEQGGVQPDMAALNAAAAAAAVAAASSGSALQTALPPSGARPAPAARASTGLMSPSAIAFATIHEEDEHAAERSPAQASAKPAAPAPAPAAAPAASDAPASPLRMSALNTPTRASAAAATVSTPTSTAKAAAAKAATPVSHAPVAPAAAAGTPASKSTPAPAPAAATPVQASAKKAAAAPSSTTKATTPSRSAAKAAPTTSSSSSSLVSPPAIIRGSPARAAATPVSAAKPSTALTTTDLSSLAERSDAVAVPVGSSSSTAVATTDGEGEGEGAADGSKEEGGSGAGWLGVGLVLGVVGIGAYMLHKDPALAEKVKGEARALAKKAGEVAQDLAAKAGKEAARLQGGVTSALATVRKA